MLFNINEGAWFNMKRFVLPVLFALVLTASAALAGNPWQASASIYFLGQGVSGSFENDDEELNVDQGFFDILGNLQPGWEANLEANNKIWLFMGDFTRVKIDAATPLGKVDADENITEGTAGWCPH